MNVSGEEFGKRLEHALAEADQTDRPISAHVKVSRPNRLTEAG